MSHSFSSFSPASISIERNLIVYSWCIIFTIDLFKMRKMENSQCALCTVCMFTMHARTAYTPPIPMHTNIKLKCTKSGFWSGQFNTRARACTHSSEYGWEFNCLFTFTNCAFQQCECVLFTIYVYNKSPCIRNKFSKKMCTYWKTIHIHRTGIGFLKIPWNQSIGWTNSESIKNSALDYHMFSVELLLIPNLLSSSCKIIN